MNFSFYESGTYTEDMINILSLGMAHEERVCHWQHVSTVAYLNLCTHSCVGIISRQHLPWCMTSLWAHIMWHHVIPCDIIVPYGCVLHYRAHREQWIRAKYERREFIPGAPPPPYLAGQSISDLIITFLSTAKLEIADKIHIWKWRGGGRERRLRHLYRKKIPEVCYLDICCSNFSTTFQWYYHHHQIKKSF